MVLDGHVMLGEGRDASLSTEEQFHTMERLLRIDIHDDGLL